MAGLRATGAEYALPLDADDRLPPGALRLLRDALEANPAAVAAWGSARHFGSLDFVQHSLPSLDPWHLSYQNHLPLSALYRRDAVLAAGGWQLDGGYEDWDLWMSLAEAGHEGVGVPAITCEYRVAPGRRLSRSSSRHAERCARLRERHPRLYAERRRHRRASPAPDRAQARAAGHRGAPAVPDPEAAARRRRVLSRPRIGLAHDRRAAARAPGQACRLIALRTLATQIRAATSHRWRQWSVSTNAPLTSSPHHAPSSAAAPTP